MNLKRNHHLETAGVFVSMEEEVAPPIQLDHCCIDQVEKASFLSKTMFEVFEEPTNAKTVIFGLLMDDCQKPLR